MSKQVLSVLDLTTDEFNQIIDHAIDAKNQPSPQPLHGKNVGIYFNRPSTRTRTSFTLAADNLGGSVMSYLPEEMQLTTGESIEDTAAVMAGYLDILVMRCHSTADILPFSHHKNLAIVNALTDDEHPSQALADFMTIKEQFGRCQGIKVLFMGEGGNIANSFLLAGARIPKMELNFICPRRYGFSADVMAQAQQLAKRSGAIINYHHDPLNLPQNVDVVYTSRWRSMGAEKDQPDWLAQYDGFQVNMALFSRVSHPKTIMMHDLPAERGAEVDHQILNSEQSVVFEQANNKYQTAKALLHWCVA